MKSKLKGTGVALVTPFLSSGKVDYSALKKILTHTAENGADYFVVLGTTGEAATLSAKEKREILDYILKNNSWGLPVVYGLGGNNTDSVVEEIKSTRLDEVDAILSVSPYYNKPSQAGIIHHYEKLADNSPVPIILYNVPGRTACNMTAATTLTLAEHPNITGIKEAGGDFEQTMRIASLKPKDFELISGDDLLLLPMLSIGATGVISVLANAYPNVFKEIQHNYFSGNHDSATASAYKIIRLHPLMYAEGSPSGIKYVLSEMNLCRPDVRLPMYHLSEKLKERISREMQSM